MNKFKKFVLGMVAAVAALVSIPSAHADIATDLTTAATTAVGTMATSTGGILVAAFAIVVGFAVYRLIKRAIGRAG